jgi:response regulator RpfG family c-di-GMP phosphodiesterase
MSKTQDFDDDLLFGDDEAESAKTIEEAPAPWKIMIVDDEPSMHDVTQLALSGATFDGRGIEFISVFSGAEAKQAIAEHPDTAIMLLDVVMETDQAGLDVARFIREDANNNAVRIVLRTGQPGQAPEQQVITEYDINDYKDKTELTAQKLFTLIYASLRSYRDIIALENNKRGLEDVIAASSTIFELKSMSNFTQGVLEQLSSLLHFDQEAVYCKSDGLAACLDGDKFQVVAATGEYESFLGGEISHQQLPDMFESVETSLDGSGSLILDDRYIGIFKGRKGTDNLLYLRGSKNRLNDMDRSLLDLFGRNISIAFQNVELHQEIEDTQREIVYLLGEAVETRSKETGNHVKRVAEISKLLALDIGLDEEEAEIIKLASPLHDLGKIGVPDAILNKPGKLTPEEWEVMKGHAMLGYEMLRKSDRRILRAGALLARDHHERWEGGGYPYNKKEDEIHIYGRITAVADVFDALGSDRCYKKAWSLEKIFDLLREERGKQFEPALIDSLLNNMDKVVAIRDAFADMTEDAPTLVE